MADEGTAAAPAPASAGALLRQAREAQGMHIAALAASLKVPPKRLEALEQDRWGDLPDAAFTRALAQSVCRALKCDPTPVLALLPRADGGRLDQVGGGINAPFRDRPGAVEPGVTRLAARPVTWVVVLLLLAALAVLLWPAPVGQEGPVADGQVAPTAEPPATPPAAVGPADTTAQPPVAAVEPEAPSDAPGPSEAPPAATAPEAPSAVTAPAAGDASAPAAAPTPLVLRASEASWVEISDATGRVIASRTLQPGESLPLEAPLPLRLTIGNAEHTEVVLRGQKVDLTPHQRGNIARLELQ